MPTKAPIVHSPMAAPYSWTGFYVGISRGGAFGTTGANETGLPNTGALAIVANSDFNLDHNLNGWLGAV
jgi:hypothetical protein